MARRPNITVQDVEAIKRLAPSVGMVDIWLGAGGQPTMERVFYRGERTKTVSMMGTTERFVEINFANLVAGRVVHRCGSAAAQGAGRPRLRAVRVAVRAREASIRSARRSALARSNTPSSASWASDPGIGGFNTGQDDFAIIPYTTYRKQFGSETRRVRRTVRRRPAAMIAVVPRDGATRDQMLDRSRRDHAHPPRSHARQAERLRHHHAGRRAEAVGADLAGDSAGRWS